MLSKKNRQAIAKNIADAANDLVSELYSPLFDGVSDAQEAEISSRLCQRLEDKLDGMQAGEYTFNVVAHSLPDRGPKSFEKILGADIFLSISLEGIDGFDKGIFIQAKYDRNIDKSDLQKSCKKMRRIAGSEGSYVWIYEPSGVKVISSHQVDKMGGNSLRGIQPRTAEGFIKRVLDCHAGTKAWGIPTGPGRRERVRAKLREVRAANIVDVDIKKRHRLT